MTFPPCQDRRHRRLKIAAGLLLSALLGFAILGQRSVVALDYRAFYCAGAALRHHQNPYHTASLRECELTRTDAQYRLRFPTTTLPAPQPLYDIALFSLLSWLPFALAKALWGAVLGIAIFVTIVSLVRLTGLSLPLVFAILATSLIGSTLALGQIVSVYTAAACGAALLVKEGRPRLAAAVALASLMEPHLGVPLCVSLAVWCRESRVVLAGGVGMLVAAAIVTGGWSANIEYITIVLPLHALSELSSDAQVSLSVVLQALHFSAGTAIWLGTFSCLVMSAFGIWAAGAAAAQFSNRAFLVTVPAAAAVVGGSFLHATDVIAAIPLAMMLVKIPRLRGLSAISIVLLATPWAAPSQPHQIVPWFLFAAAVAAYVLWRIGNVRPVASLCSGVLIFFALCQVNFAYERDQNAYVHQPHVITAPIDEKYPQAGWERVNVDNLATQSAPAWIMRAPTWAGLLVLLGATAAALSRRVKVVFA